MVLSVMLCLTAFGLRTARAQTAPDAGKTRSEVAKLGVGSKARVEVRLRDKTKVKGYVSAAGQDSFNVTDRKTGETRTVAYAEVSKVRRPGGGLSPLTWGIIGGAAAAAIIVGVTVVKPVLCDGGAGC